MTELYTNLPGFSVEYKDRGLVVPLTVASTDKVTVIGTAADGPMYEPIPIISQDEGETIFGKPYNVSTLEANGDTLLLGYSETYGAGARNISLTRIGGKMASGVASEIMSIDSYYAGALYNGVQYMIDLSTGTEKFCIKKPNVKGGEIIEIVLGTKTVAELAAAINSHADNNVIIATVGTGVGAGAGVAKSTLSATPPHATLTTAFAGLGNLKFTSVASPGTDVSVTLTAATDSETTTVTVNTKDITIALARDTTVTATVASVKTAFDLVTAATALVTVEVIGAGTGLAEAKTKTSLVNTPAYSYLTGGSDSPNISDVTYIEDMYIELHKAYVAIEDYDTDIVVALGVYADDEFTITQAGAENIVTNFAEQLANVCAKATEKSNEMFGVIAVEPILTATREAIKARVDELVDSENMYYRLQVDLVDEGGAEPYVAAYTVNLQSGSKQSVGHLISVVAMPEGNFYHNVLGSYYSPLTAAYAGLTSSISPASAPTNKVIPNIRKLRYKLSPAQLDTLTEKRYVTFREKNQSIVVTDACTACLVEYDAKGNLSFRSDYWRLSTLRSTFISVAAVREAAEPFIGEPNELPQQNALETAIRSKLDALKAKGVINNYRFTISATLAQKVLGDSYIFLEIVPALERRRIKVTVALRTSL